MIQVRLQQGGEEIYAYDPEGNLRDVKGFETQGKLLCLQRTDGGDYTVLGMSE